MRNTQLIIPFNQLGIRDIPLVGGKNASLGEMYQHLTKKGVKVPPGFAITAYAYHYFLKATGTDKKIKEILHGLNTNNLKDLALKGKAVRAVILQAEFPDDLKIEILKHYKKLCADFKTENVDVAVRSSATAEDLPDASFAGQQESYLNIKGESALLKACRECVASLFTDRAISYRVDKHFDHFKIGLSIGVQKMVRSDKGSSGVMFTIDTESGFRDVVVINSSYGLGEYIVKGSVTPDEFMVFKPTLKKGYAAIIKQQLGSKDKKLVYASGSQATQNEVVKKVDSERFSISDQEVLQLAKWGMVIEEHYKRPMDIEWAKDGVTNQLWIVQARPETVEARKNITLSEAYHLKKTSKVLLSGTAVGGKIGQGKVMVIKSVKEISQFKPGSVLVTKMTDPDWEPVMKQAAAIITDEGGRTCHAAIVSRELGIPCVVGTGTGSKVLKTGMEVTVSCAEGEVGNVYEGILPFVVEKHDFKKINRPKVKIMMNVGEPHQAFNFSFLPNDGVGLAREEFVINDQIKAHPLALINYATLKDKKAKAQIDALTVGYKNKTDYFIDKLAHGVAQIAAAFYPKDVIVRLSDFRTNEYANLVGGKAFEPTERNPMIGWRGASRYYDPKYEPAFRLECQALKKVREEFGLTNLKIMVPFCRTVLEGQKVIAIMASEGLKRGKNGLEVYVMCEIPSNVILVREFAKIFDGFSIGSNDLTQLTLGVDRDSELVSHVYDERNEAVKSLIRQVIRECKIAKRKIGICGQAPSDFPDFAEFLMKEKIDSISLNPDTVIATTMRLAKQEKKMGQKS